jgi:LysM repeat protein
MFPARPRRPSSRVASAAPRTVNASEAQALLLPLVIAFILALVLAWPSRVHAQPAAVQTASGAGVHTVRPGETLWSLAARYFGDGYQWRELASLNGIPEGGERGLLVGQVLRVPATAPPLAQVREAMAEVPPAETPAVAVLPAVRVPEPDAPVETAAARAVAAELVAVPAVAVTPMPAEPVPAEPVPAEPVPAEPAPAPVRPAPLAPAPLAPIAPPSVIVEDTPVAPAEVERTRRIGLVRPADLTAARGLDNATIFIGPAAFDADTMAGTVWLTGSESFVVPATRREGEFQAAPVALASDEWRNAGRVRGRVQAAGGSLARAQTQRVQQRDLVEITLPPGLEAVVGDRVVSVSAGAELGKGARLAMPTGVLEIVSVGEQSSTARVIRLYGVVEQGQAIVPHVEAPAPATEAVSAVDATVRWITDAPLLPSLQAYLLLTPEEDAELAPGDRFELLSSGSAPSRVAVVRVVRVTSEGATAIVVQQEQPAIKVGMAARRVGRAP